VWDLESGRETRRIEGADSAYTYLSPNGRYLLLNSGDGIFDLREGRLTGSAGYGVKAAVSPDSRAIFVARDRSLRKIDLATGQEIARRDVDFEGASWKEVSPDGRTLALAVGGGRIVLADAHTLAVRATLEVPGDETMTVVAFARRGRVLVVVASSGRVFHFAAR
jgi:WD40 repeat protein